MEFVEEFGDMKLKSYHNFYKRGLRNKFFNKYRDPKILNEIVKIVQEKDIDGVSPIEYAWVNSSLDIYQIINGFLSSFNSSKLAYNILEIPQYHVTIEEEGIACVHS